MAASFNDELLYEVFDAVSDEARAKNRRFNERGQYKRDVYKRQPLSFILFCKRATNS